MTASLPPMPSPSTRPLPSTPAWYWRLPSLTIGLMLIAIIALAWMTRHFDDEKQHEVLINDVRIVESPIEP